MIEQPPSRIAPLEGGFNFRDIGGYRGLTSAAGMLALRRTVLAGRIRQSVRADTEPVCDAPPFVGSAAEKRDDDGPIRIRGAYERAPALRVSR